jgi:hypothetical protein
MLALVALALAVLIVWTLLGIATWHAFLTLTQAASHP